MRRAKIVCTLGPATDSYEMVYDLMKAGMDVARLNLSHGTHADHTERFQWVRQAASELKKQVAILADLQGPKIRLGTFADGSAELVEGQEFTITTDKVDGTAECCSTTFAGLPADVSVGDHILVDDGRITLEVTGSTDTEVITTVIEGGTVSNHKGINLPGVSVSVPALSEKDREDLRWALSLGADWIALSFVRSASDFVDIYRIMDEMNIRVPVIAKIEKPQAVRNLTEVVQTFDGIMVARGDLGVELPLEEVPLVQKQIIDLARSSAKPVIVATQMLDSMVTASRPTRAEASDVANAVLDGADALMLSGETSVGVDPVAVVETMARIITTVEKNALDELPPLREVDSGSTARSVTAAAIDVSRRVEATNMFSFTETGLSARLVARHRAPVPLLAFSPNEEVCRQLALLWGTEPINVARAAHTDDMISQIETELFRLDRAQIGERVVVVSGSPPGIPGTTNSFRVHRIGAITPPLQREAP